MNDVGTISWNDHNLDAAAQHVLIFIDMTLLRVNDKKMSSIQHYISLEEENKPDSSVISIKIYYAPHLSLLVNYRGRKAFN